MADVGVKNPERRVACPENIDNADIRTTPRTSFSPSARRSVSVAHAKGMAHASPARSICRVSETSKNARGVERSFPGPSPSTVDVSAVPAISTAARSARGSIQAAGLSAASRFRQGFRQRTLVTPAHPTKHASPSSARRARRGRRPRRRKSPTTAGPVERLTTCSSRPLPFFCHNSNQ